MSLAGKLEECTRNLLAGIWKLSGILPWLLPCARIIAITNAIAIAFDLSARIIALCQCNSTGFIAIAIAIAIA